MQAFLQDNSKRQKYKIKGMCVLHVDRFCQAAFPKKLQSSICPPARSRSGQGLSTPQPPVPLAENLSHIATCCPYWEMQPSYSQPRATPRITGRVALCIQQTPLDGGKGKGETPLPWRSNQCWDVSVSALCTEFCHQTGQVSILLALPPSSYLSMASGFTSLSFRFCTCKTNSVIPTFQH